MGVTHTKTDARTGGSASLDVGDRRVNLECLSDRDATLRAEFGVPQAANEGKRGGNKKEMVRMLLSFAVTKMRTSKWRVAVTKCRHGDTQ